MIAAIRAAERRDIPAIARLHVASWRESYRGIVPDQTLQGLDVPSRERMWHEAMGDVPASREVVVAEALLRHTEESVGFASCGPAWDSDLNTDGEIEAVYVLNRAQYRGIGTRLMGAAAATLAARGMQSVGLWCARGQHGRHRFLSRARRTDRGTGASPFRRADGAKRGGRVARDRRPYDVGRAGAEVSPRRWAISR